MGMIFSTYFSQLFSSSNPSNIDICIRHIQLVVTDAMSASLIVEFTEIEIKDVVFQMNGLGAFDPDGFLALFFQKNWDLVKKEVFDFVTESFKSRIALEGVNHTFLNLIPKVKNAKKLGEFRPISLCNIIDKILA